MPRPRTRTAAVDLSRACDVPHAFKTTTPAFNYTRLEKMVPMRDGVKLFTLIAIPKDAPGPMPVVLTRTPYGAAGRASRTASPDVAMALPPVDEDLVRDGYIRVYQDVRGRFRSKGRYIMTMPTRGPFNRGRVDQVTDAWDTVDWLVQNVPGNSGRVGITGVSYDGFLTLMALLDPHPALKAAVPVNAMVDCWIGDDFYRHGALRTVMLEYVYRQTASRNASHGIPWGYHDFYNAVLEAGSVGQLGRRYGADRLPAWNRLLDHPAYDAYWQDQAVQQRLAKAPRKVPVLTVHSLFDQEDIYGPVLSHAALAERDRTGRRTHLAIGPWCHGQMTGDGSELGSMKWGADTSLQFRTQMLTPFWDHHLKGVKPAEPLPPVLAFETGTNQWRTCGAWPPRDETEPARLYLQPGGGLAFAAPGADSPSCTEYVSDPAKPVPYRVPMPDANHTFLPGHRILVQVQSSWFPVYDRNPQTFVPNIFFAKPADYRKAVQRIYRDSFVELPVVK